MNLSEIKTGQECVITKINGYGSFRNRIMEMGFVKNRKVRVVRNAPLLDPIEYSIMNTHVSLRRSEARLIEVIPVSPGAMETIDDPGFLGTMVSDKLFQEIRNKSKVINVALVGNPNSGKTTLFNDVTGMHEKVGNYGGVTVDAKVATTRHGDYTLHIVDLPGTYSITEYSPEEVFVRRHITERHPDVVLNIVDATNLERNLFLTTQLLDMDVRIVMALNMYDEFRKDGGALDTGQLGKLLGMPVIPTVASKGEGLGELFDAIVEVFEDRNPLSREVDINYSNDIEAEIRNLEPVIGRNANIAADYSLRYLSLKLLEGDRVVDEALSHTGNYSEIKEAVQKSTARLDKVYKEDLRTVITTARYAFIHGALKETMVSEPSNFRRATNSIDRILTHRWAGIPLLLLFLWLMFQATFTLGSFPMEWIELGVSKLGVWVASLLPEGPLNDLLVDGIIAGVGGVVVFLPNILIMFFFISLMEDSGYMARAAFIMDRMMHKIGLHGKSFIPLLIGFGCNVPAIMATRTLESRKDRILTMLITPLMSCSARLPVYILLVSAFFTRNQGLVLLSVYVAGIVLAVIFALLFKRLFFRGKSDPFVMEIPPYRMPGIKNTVVHMWDKGGQYLKKMGTIILAASILIWTLGYYPRMKEAPQPVPAPVEQAQATPGMPQPAAGVEALQFETSPEVAQLEQSYIGRLGKGIEPVIAPLGFDWKMGVSILSGVAAKEIVVSTMGVLYHVGGDATEESQNLISSIRADRYTSGPHKGEKVFSPLVAYGFMLFILIYFPCMAAVVAIRKEAGTGWALFTMVYTTLAAWLVAFGVFQIGSLF